MLKDEIENAQLREELKNKQYMAKYDLACQVNKLKFLKNEHSNKYGKAAAHQHSLEAKHSEIYLRKVETKIHDTLAHAHTEAPP
jgi:hypothetical protein